MKFMTNAFTFLASLLLSSVIYAENGPTASGVSLGVKKTLDSGDCINSEQDIKVYCSENQSLQEGSSADPLMQMADNGQQQDGKMLSTVKGNQQTATMAQGSMVKATAECKEALKACEKKCTSKEQQEQQKYTAAKSSMPPNQPLMSRAQADAQEARRIKNYCKKEAQGQVSKNKMKMAEIAQLIQALAGLLKGLGGKDDGDFQAAAIEQEEDKCDGPNASLILECSGQSDPIASRAGVSGQTGVGDLSGGKGKSLFGPAAESEEDEYKDRSDKAVAAGFKNNGLGAGFGNTGFPGTGVSSASAGKEKLDTDIYKGYMGGGGSGAIGSYGGGGGGARSGRSRANPYRGVASTGRKKLQSALDRVAAAGKRGLASADGTNGPYQNIWGVVTKTYKKTSSSMFHKE